LNKLPALKFVFNPSNFANLTSIEFAREVNCSMRSLQEENSLKKMLQF